jgi:F-type H+-transporting ATPase subunit b
MPQLYQLALVFQSQWFWLLLVLASIYIFVGHGIVPKVEATVDDRDAKIAADLAEAERLRGDAGSVEAAWHSRMNEAHVEAQGVTAAAKAKADANAQKRVAKADAEISAKLASAEASLAEARANALHSLEAVAAEAAQDITAKVSGAQVSKAQAAAAVKAVFAHG